MKWKVEYPAGATPLDPDEMNGLIPIFISTQNELNILEQENILAGKNWLLKTKKELLAESFVRELHKKMYSDVWKWAGQYRRTQKTIGIEAAQISTQIKNLMLDTKTWMDQKSYPWAEIFARFHHRLVFIHPFANGNGRYARFHTEALALKYEQKVPSWGENKFSGNLNKDSQLRSEYITALQQADQRNFHSLIAFLYS